MMIQDQPECELLSTLVASNQAAPGGIGSGGLFSGSQARLVHTTLAHNRGGDGSGLTLLNSTGALTNTILVSQTVGITATAGSMIQLDATLWGQGAWANHLDWGGAGSVAHTHDFYGDPHFTDPPLGDYHIGPESTALDRGLPTSLVADLDDQPRPDPITGLPDVGADEYWVAVPVSSVSIAAPITATTGISITFTAIVSPTTATPNLHYIWVPEPEAGQGTDMAVYTWLDAGVYTLSVTAQNAAGQASAEYAIQVLSRRFETYLPWVGKR
jgi:hypothetical protein